VNQDVSIWKFGGCFRDKVESRDASRQQQNIITIWNIARHIRMVLALQLTPQLIMLVLILHIGESTRAPAESASFPNHHKCGTHDIRLRFSGGVLTLPTGEVERGGDGPQ
jgi:hypothetical protein